MATGRSDYRDPLGSTDLPAPGGLGTAREEQGVMLAHTLRIVWIFMFTVLAVGGAAFAEEPSTAAEPAEVFANQSHIYFQGPDGNLVRGYRCGTPEPSLAEMAAVAQDLAQHQGAGQRGRKIGVPVAFHVIYKVDEEGHEIGIPPNEQIEAQIEVLNQAYGEFRFTLDSVDYFEQTEQEPWFDRCYQQNFRMKRALAISPETTLNIYSCDPHYGKWQLLGFAYLPWSFPEDDYRHGVVLLHSSLPGGTAVPYDEGDTATHEAGHYFGLLHTFQNGCTEPGDEIDDTPFEATAAFGCPEGRDTCPQVGLDPIYNFMDYTDDPCMDHFTTDQDVWMIDMVELYRPTLLLN